MVDSTTHVIRGRLDWCKLLGDPRMNTYTNEREWSVDVTPDEDGMKEIKRIGAADKLKDPKENDKRTERFLAFRQREFRKDPKTDEPIPNKPVKVTDVTGKDWDPTVEIGNGTIADVKFTRKDYGRGKPKGLYIQAVRILQLVEFQRQDFAPLSPDDEFFAGANQSGGARTDGAGSVAKAGAARVDVEDDLDDDLPF